MTINKKDLWKTRQELSDHMNQYNKKGQDNELILLRIENLISGNEILQKIVDEENVSKQDQHFLSSGFVKADLNNLLNEIDKLLND